VQPIIATEPGAERPDAMARAQPSTKRARWPRPTLILLTTLPVLLEVLVTSRQGLPSATAFAPQVTALEPFGVFHDVRWLIVYSNSWRALALQAVAWLLLRSLLLTAIIRAAWPAHGPRQPTWTELLPRVSIAVLVLALLMAPWAGLLFAVAIVSVSWLFLAAIPSALVVALLVHGAVVETGWWRKVPSGRAMLLIAATFAALTIEGAFLATVAEWEAILVSIAAGLFNAWAWTRLVAILVHRDAPVRAIPVAPLGVAALVAVILLGLVLGLGDEPGPSRAGVAPPYPHSARRPVMVVTGFGSSWDGGTRISLGTHLDTFRFSYRGLDRAGAPLAYDREDTHASVPVLAHRLGQQIDALHAATDRPIAIVAESEGSVIAKTYLAAHPEAPVHELVMLSPIVHPGRVYAPPLDDKGWGVAGDAELQGLSALLRAVSTLDVSTDTPLLRSFIDGAPTIRDLVGCGLPGVHQLVLFPVADAVAAPHPSFTEIPFNAVPAFHGGLINSGAVQQTIVDALDHKPTTNHPVARLLSRLVQRSATAWQVPQVSFGLVDEWKGTPNDPSCAQMRSSARRWLERSSPDARLSATAPRH
jgi:hypothetical protein